MELVPGKLYTLELEHNNDKFFKRIMMRETPTEAFLCDVTLAFNEPWMFVSELSESEILHFRPNVQVIQVLTATALGWIRINENYTVAPAKE